MMKFFYSLVFFLLLSHSTVLASGVTPSDPKVESFIQSLSNEALAVVQSKTLDTDQKYDALKTIFNDNVDTRWMARFVLGKYWLSLSEDEQAKYQSLYHEFLMLSYLPKFKSYNNQKISIKRYIVDDTKSGEYTVQTDIVDSDGTTININYRVRALKSGDFKVFDIIAEGVSLITTQRSDFSAFLSRKSNEEFFQLLARRIEGMKEANK